MPVCIAQEPKPTADPVPDSGPVMLASFGWGGLIRSDRWGPITVHVSTGDSAVAGTIVVEFPQDETQTARISVPFAATPNRTTQVPIVAALPANCDRVAFSMVDDHGRVVRSLTYTRNVTDRTASLPPMMKQGRGLFVCVGRCSLPDSVRAWTDSLNPIRAQRVGRPGRATSRADLDWSWTRSQAAQAAPDQLPAAWMAYDGLAALVVSPQGVGPSGRTADPRAIDAVHQWVRSGGRLIVMADGPGDAWRAWIPAEAKAFVELDAAATGPLPRIVSEAILGAIRAAATSARLLTESDPKTSPEPTMPGPTSAAPYRAVHLSEAAQKAGWSGRWELEGESPAPLIAEGPVGYGHVVVMGLDPMRTPAEVSARASGAVWKSALEPAVMDWLRRSSLSQASGYYTGGPQERANNAAVERLGDVPVIGDSVFVVIAAAVLVLIALVGPVDFFVLRRLRSGHRSWLTALAWIGLACAVAYGAPRLLRTAPTQINRLTVVDRMVGAAGDGPLTYSTGMTGIYAGESGTATVVDPDPTSWWRGRSVDYGEREFRGLALVPTVQAAAGGAAGSTRGNPLVEVPLALWTFRAFADDSIPSAAWAGLNARVQRAGAGYQAVVAGLPKGAVVGEATLRVGDKWFGLTEKTPLVTPEPPKPAYPVRTPRDLKPPTPAPITPVGQSDAGSWSGFFRDEFGAGVPSRAWSNPPPDPNSGYYYPWYAGQALDVRPGPLLDLPGADRRGQAVERCVATGRYAAVYLNVVACPSDVKLGWPAQTAHTAVLRLVVPLESEP